jgi:chromosome segregation ATPase
MAEFTPITTQEEFDAAIGERLKREKEATAKKISDYEAANTKLSGQVGSLTKELEEANKKISGFDEERTALTAKIQGYESDSVKTRIALEIGLPYEMASRLSGDDEETIRKDAEGMYKLIGNVQPTPPLKSTEGDPEDDKTAAYKSLLGTVKGEE